MFKNQKLLLRHDQLSQVPASSELPTMQSQDELDAVASMKHEEQIREQKMRQEMEQWQGDLFETSQEIEKLRDSISAKVNHLLKDELEAIAAASSSKISMGASNDEANESDEEFKSAASA